MSFKTDGSSHHNGISGEKIILDQVRNNPALQTYLGGVETASHFGGTANKADIQFRRPTGQAIGISVKTRSSSTGTFDWVNSSTLIQSMPGLSSIKEYCDGVRGIHADTTLSRKEGKESIEICRAAVTLKVTEALTTLSTDSSRLRQILQLGLSPYLEASEFYVSLHYKKERRSAWFEFKTGHLIVPLLQDPSVSFYLKGSKSSRVIWCVLSDGSHYNTMIRLRVHLNNGVGALVAGKKWSANPTSALVVKLQQDTPEKLLEQIKDTQTFML